MYGVHSTDEDSYEQDDSYSLYHKIRGPIDLFHSLQHIQLVSSLPSTLLLTVYFLHIHTRSNSIMDNTGSPVYDVQLNVYHGMPGITACSCPRL
jgi:hypothetical protein